jgi:hypothetical protein
VTGLSFELTAEQEQLRQMVRDFADRECPKDVARRLEASKDFPEGLARRIAKAGLNGIGVPEEYGGQGGDLLDQTIVCEELSRTLGGLAWLWGITVWSGARAILHHGNAAQKESYLPAVAAGDLRFAFAMTEPAGGTDVLRDDHQGLPRGRRLCPARDEDLVDDRARGGPHHGHRPDQLGGSEAVAGADHLPGGREIARAHGDADPEDRDALAGIVRGRLRRRVRA